MTKNSTSLRTSTRFSSSTSYHIVTLLICVLGFHSNPSTAEDNNKDMSATAKKHENMNHKDMNHGEMTHESMSHGNGKHDDMKHKNMNHADMEYGDHGHTPVDVSNWPSTPSLTLTAHKDAMTGWNLHIVPTHFDFAPEQVNSNNVVGKGHAHLYVNGKKITRLYSSWYYLNNLQPGIHSVTVSLNANDHGPLVLQDKYLSATIELLQE